MRTFINLNYDWDFIPNFKKEYLNQKTISKSSKVSIPHTMKELPFNYFNEEDYQFVGTYSKVLDITETMKSSNLIVHFEGVMNICKVYLNGELVVIHEGGYTPFDVDITESSNVGDNVLQVIVDSSEVPNVPPFGHFVDFLAFSGIYREVRLDILPKAYIETLHVSTTEAQSFIDEEMIIEIDLHIKQELEEEYKVSSVIFLDGNIVFTSTFDSGIIDQMNFSSLMKGIKRWSIDTPVLYTLQIQILKEDEVVDQKTTTFGFRTVVFTPEGFFLNNQPIKLIGLNRHQSYPYVGYAMPKSMQELDADILKEFGCNIVRTSHYMQSEHFLNRCDEIGLLVLEETPGWQYIGDEHFKELTYQNIEVMIHHHYNHPSIITWGIRINESKDDHDFYEKTNAMARSLDTTRQTCGVRNTTKGEFLEDIYTYNDFSHVGYNEGLENPNKITKGYIPYLVTEHNGHVFPTKKFDGEARRIEQAMRHTSVIDSAHRYKRISGAIGWCLADYNTHMQFGSNDRICYHGVMDMFRIPKYAAYAYKSQKETEPVLFVASNMIPGDRKEFKLDETVVFTNCDSVKVYKNDQFIGEYFSEWKSYPDIPFAPVIIDDFIGDLIIQSNEFKPRDARRITDLLISYNLNGFAMPFKDKMKYLGLTLRKVVDFPKLMVLFENYIAMQQAGPTVFKFEGYIDDELVITNKRGQSKASQLTAKQNTSELVHGDTYDVARIIVDLQDEHQNTCTYSNLSVNVTTSSHLELIGPSSLSLTGGSTGIYVKTNGKEGTAWVKITSNSYPEIKLNFVIKKEC